jgi:hypothetical protein
MKIVIIIDLIIIVLSSGDPVDDRLEIINSSNDTVYYLITEFENLERMYDSELVEKGINITYKNYVYDLSGGANRKHIKTGSVKAWENYIEKVCENNKLYVFIFDIDMLKVHSWKEVVQNGYFKERKSYSLQDIRNLNWKIVLG